MVAEAKKRILITGINGMLGKELGPVLESKFLIIGMDLQNNGDGNYDYHCCDITNKEQLKRVFEEIRPWLVIHAAAFTDVDGCETDPDKAEAINIKGTKNIVGLCLEYKAKLVFISTDYVFNGEKPSAYAIDDAACPLSVYGRTKFEAEQFVLKQLPDGLIVRTSWLFGKGGKNFVKTIIEKSAQLDALQVVNDQRGSPTYTLSLSMALKELIQAVFLTSKQAENYGIYHVSNSENCTWYEFAKKIADFDGLPSRLIKKDESKRSSLRPENITLNIDKTYKKLGLKKNEGSVNYALNELKD